MRSLGAIQRKETRAPRTDWKSILRKNAAADPGSVLEHDDHGHSHDHDHSHDHAHITEPADAAHADQPTPAG